MKTYFLLLIFSLLSTFQLSAAVNNEFRFRHFTVEDGLSSNGVRGIVQDKQGYIWFDVVEGADSYHGDVYPFFSAVDYMNASVIELKAGDTVCRLK